MACDGRRSSRSIFCSPATEHPTWSASSFCNRPSALRRRLINAPKDVSLSIASSHPARLLFIVLGSSIVLLLYVLCIARSPQLPAGSVFHKQVEESKISNFNRL